MARLPGRRSRAQGSRAPVRPDGCRQSTGGRGGWCPVSIMLSSATMENAKSTETVVVSVVSVNLSLP